MLVEEAPDRGQVQFGSDDQLKLVERLAQSENAAFKVLQCALSVPDLRRYLKRCNRK
jgi:hypothetical protein